MTKITNQHAEYQKMVQPWRRCRDFMDGADALRKHDIACNGDATTAYIPKLSPKQSNTEYEAYIRRALYDNVTRRTSNSLLGLVFSSDPETDISASIDYMTNDCDMMETPLIEMAAWIAAEVVNIGRCGILVDRPPSDKVESRLDAERGGYRPYFVPYTAEQITNWKLSRVGNRWMITRVVLAESPELYTELTLTAEGYGQTLWNKVKDKDEWIPKATVFPKMNGNAIMQIPFFFFGPRSGKCKIEAPPLIDLIEDARSWYQSSADLEHARFSCSVPTAYFLGFTDDEAKSIVLGGLNGIVSTNPEAKVGFLEYTGQGTEPLERALEQKYKMMARHGVDLLSDKKDAEAHETVRARVGLQTATLQDIAKTTSRILSQALTFASTWMGGSSSTKSTIVLNTEYMAAGIEPQEITALLASVQSGKLPIIDFIRRLRKGKIIEADRTDEEILEELALVEEQQGQEIGGAA